MKVNLRMNLSDFLNTDYEKEAIDKLDAVHRDSVKFYLTLWYEDGLIEPRQIKKFILDYENRLHLKTSIKVGNELKFSDFIWFDLVKSSDRQNSSRIRFQYEYQNLESILAGLEEFHKCAKFCISEKPRKQKRNDYESSNSR